MRSPSRTRMVLKWSPSRRRRVLTLCGLALSVLIGVTRIVSIPWSWRYIDDMYLQILLYVVFIPTVVSLCLGFRRVFPQGHCQKCGYNLTGNVSGVCPECGEQI